MRILASFLAVSLLFGCEKKKTEIPYSETASKTTIRYAEGFSVTYMGKNKLVEVKYPFQGATSGYKYLLVAEGEEVPPRDADVRVIHIPLTSIVCTSTTHIPLLDYLDESDKLSGFPTTDYISSEKTRKYIDAGNVTELGVDKGMNMERLAVLKPDMVMGYVMSSDYGQFKKIEELGIPVVINSEYLEKSPLGRAEWIKFMALFFNKEKEADSVFTAIEKEYLETKRLVDSVEIRPTVLSGIVYGDAWFLPGGQNYASIIAKDAGCAYLWERDNSNGFLQLSFESVYERAHAADFWIGLGSYATLEEVKSADERYIKFIPYKSGNVYNYNKRLGAKGGNEYLELGYVRPDIILKDLVKIAHPTLLPGYELYFYKKLK